MFFFLVFVSVVSHSQHSKQFSLSLLPPPFIHVIQTDKSHAQDTGKTIYQNVMCPNYAINYYNKFQNDRSLIIGLCALCRIFACDGNWQRCFGCFPLFFFFCVFCMSFHLWWLLCLLWLFSHVFVCYDFHWFLLFPLRECHFSVTFIHTHSHILETTLRISLFIIKQSKVCRTLIYIQMREFFWGRGFVCLLIEISFGQAAFPFHSNPFLARNIFALRLFELMYTFKGQLINSIHSLAVATVCRTSKIRHEFISQCCFRLTNMVEVKKTENFSVNYFVMFISSSFVGRTK